MVFKFTKILKSGYIYLLIGLLSGCSTIITESEFDVQITSTPSDTAVVVRDVDSQIIEEGLTPAVFTLRSYGNGFDPAQYRIELLDDKQITHEENLRANVSPSVFGNLLFGVAGVVTVLIDVYTGAMYDLPKAIHIDLNQQRADSTVTPDENL